MNDMVDMAQFVEAKSDQLNADDLIGGPRTVTITRVTGNDGDQPVSIFYQGDNGKPFKPCKTIRRVLLGVWGRHAQEYVGRSMTLYRDDNVTFGGLNVGGIRISHMSNIDQKTLVVVNKSKGKKVGMEVLPLAAQIDKVAAGVKDLIDRIMAGEDVIDVAATVKQRAWLAKNRPELAAEVDAAIAAVTPAATEDDPFAEGSADDDMGEAHTDDGLFADPRQAKADEIIAACAGIKTKAELEALKDLYEADINALPDELVPLVAGAIDGAAGRAK